MISRSYGRLRDWALDLPITGIGAGVYEGFNLGTTLGGTAL